MGFDYRPNYPLAQAAFAQEYLTPLTDVHLGLFLVRHFTNLVLAVFQHLLSILKGQDIAKTWQKVLSRIRIINYKKVQPKLSSKSTHLIKVLSPVTAWTNHSRSSKLNELMNSPILLLLGCNLPTHYASTGNVFDFSH